MKFEDKLFNPDQVRGHGVADLTAYYISKFFSELLFEPMDVMLNERRVVFVDEWHFRIHAFLVLAGRRNVRRVSERLPFFKCHDFIYRPNLGI